jgi:hypothetical protein
MCINNESVGAVFLKSGVAAHLCVPKILQCAAKKVYCSCPTDYYIKFGSFD